jgi:hypothetical protein
MLMLRVPADVIVITIGIALLVMMALAAYAEWPW